MGNYLTNAEMIEWLGTDRAAQLSADSGTAPDTDLIDEGILGAEGEIDSALAVRVAVPVDVSGSDQLAGLLGKLTRALTTEELARRRPPISEDEQKAVEWARAWLVAFVAGEAALPEPSGDGSSGGNIGEWGARPQNRPEV